MGKNANIIKYFSENPLIKGQVENP